MKTKVKPYHLTCQNCYKQYETIKDFKVHVRSIGHKQEVARLFQTVYLPILAIMDYLRNPNQTDPLIGLDMVTFCITPEKYGAFYLCHICEERLSSQDIIQHLCSVEHYFKHLAYSNPELLRFAWFKDSFSYLQHSAVRENHTNGSGALRILELPKLLLKRGKKLLYHQVMTMFSKTGKLTECIRAHRPQRKTLQAYITDPARTNPLLGLNFLVEYSCPDSEWHCGYLCILCKKKLPAIDGISHCISFDHVYWYLHEVHPATLECTKSTYTHYSYGFHKKVLYLANQAQTHNPPEEIQSVHLDLSGFKDVASSSYKNALDKLQLIRRGRDQSEIKPSVARGGQILYTAEDHEFSVSKTTKVCLAEEKTHKADSGTQNGEHCQYILCVECDQTFSFITGYKNHIRGWEHGQKLVDLFGSGLYTACNTCLHVNPVFWCPGTISVIKLYQYLWARHLKDSPPPLIGLQLFTVLVDRQSPCISSPLYLCHACEINISTSASAHLTSTQHYFNVFAHTKPDLVFLGARNSSNITEFAREEEARQGKENTVLRVCEIPSHLWRMFKSLAYEKIMATIWKHHSKLNKCFEVPNRVTLQTYAKSGDRKSPLLASVSEPGLQFMVKYSTTQPYPKCGYLCLLCERRLSEMHAIAHILSFSHVLAYLNVTHPGSLNKDDGDQRLLIVDLAQQAEKVCHNEDLQEVELEFGKFHELDTSPFTAALNALQLYCRQKGLGELKTPVPGARLVSSLEKEHPLQSVQQESLSVASKTEQIHHDSTETSPPETHFKVPDVLKLEGPPKSTNTANSASTSAQHHYPMEIDVEPLGHMPHYHNPTEAKEFYQTARPPQTKDSSFPQEQSELAHNQGNPSEALQNILQTSTCINKAQAVLQSSTELWNYLKTTNREPVIGGITFSTSPEPVTSVTCAQVKPALICEKHKAPVADLPILVFCGKCQSSSTVLATAWSAVHLMMCTSGHAPNETTDGVLGDLLSDLDQVILELLDSLKCNLAVLDGSKQCPKGVLLDLGQASRGASHWYPFLYPPRTACKLSSHEARQGCAPGGTQVPLHQRRGDSGNCGSCFVFLLMVVLVVVMTEMVEVRVMVVKVMEIVEDSLASKSNLEFPLYTLQLCPFSIFERPLLLVEEVLEVTGMNSVIECHSDGKPPIFICVSCTKRVKESSVVKHLTSRDHQIIYMKSVKYAPVLAKRKVKTKWLRIHAILLEKSEGYGETQLLELDAKDYHEILCSPIVSVLRKLRDSLLKLTSENGDQCAKAVDDSRCDDRPETLESLKKPEGMDGPCGGTAISNDSKPDTTLKQCSDEDPIRSSPHLWSYLSSPSRTEPIIGLNMVTEYRSSSCQSSFLCSCCKVLLPTSKYMCHLISPRHRFTYLKEKHPKLVELWKDQVDLTYKIAELQAKAKSVQDSEGWGQLKVVVKRESPNLKEQAAKNVENSNDAPQAESPQAGSAAVCTEPQGHNSKRQNPTKLLKMKKMNKQSAVIGLNFVTCVSHEKKKLFFCELCSVRCHIEHMSSETHKKTCVEHRYPGWTKSDPSMKRLDDITLHLAAVERSTGIGIKKLSVTAEVFTALRTAPISEALSQLKLQQTKLEAGVDLRGSCSSVVMNSNKATDHGTNNDIKNLMPSVPAAIRSLEPEHAPVLETSVMPDESPDPLSGSHSGPLTPLGPCSMSVVPVLPHATLFSPSDVSSSKVHTQAEPYSRISPPPTVLYNIQASSVPLPPLPPSVPDLPPLSVSYNPQPVHDPLPVFSNPENSMRFSPPPIYEPVSPPLMYEPISPPSLYEPGSPPSPSKPISPPYSGSPYSPTPSIASSLPQPSKRHLIEVENQADGSVCEDCTKSREQASGPCTTHEQFSELTHSFVVNISTLSIYKVSTVYRPNKLLPNLINFCFLSRTVAGQSNAYLFLSLRNLFSTEPIIGLSNILECRTTARPTFFLCLNCAVKIITKDFCCHMTSERHQYISIRIQYPEIFQKWQWQTNHKLTIRDLAERLALEEQGLDAKVIKLDQKQYENLQSADFLNAIEILQRMYGPEPSSLSSPLRGQTQRGSVPPRKAYICAPEIFAERLLKDCEETDTHRHQPQQHWNVNSSQSAQHGLHSGFIGLDSMQGNRSTRDRVLCSQSPQKTRKDPEVTMVQPQQTQPQFNVQAGLTAESKSINTESSSSEMHTESTSETPGACCANSLPSQSPESTVQGLQPITAQTFPCLIKEIKQEKPDYDEVSQRTCSFAADVVPSLEVPCSKEAAEGKPFKHSSNLKEYINSKRAVSDAVVGLSSVIQCQCEGQAPLYLCVSCSRKLNHDLIINHLLKPGHRDSYLRRRYPWMFEDLSDSDSRPQTFVMLMRLAQKVEKTYEDEPGQLQVMEVQCAELKEIRSLSFDQAITQLQKIREKQGLCALQTCISPKIQTVLVKKEKMEMEVTTQHSTQLPDLPEMRCGEPTSVTSPVMPGYPMPYAYH
ncbi:hypothetical protein NFI96_016388, partial [Prochilodus magdalenae]